MHAEKWFVKTKWADFRAWADELGIDPVIARILRNREMLSAKEAEGFLRGELSDCHSPWKLKDMEAAVISLLQALKQGKRIRVIGDYDVDGICSTYILTKGIDSLGGIADYAIPHRIHDGYGLNEQLILNASQDGVQMILTCDNGISAKNQIAYARSLGMEVIVTDHHEVPFEMENGVKREILPEALAIVDPKRKEDTYPFDGICGAVVAFKLMQAVWEVLAGEHPLEDCKIASKALSERADSLKDNLDMFLEFAALATVCDVMELKDENRIIVRAGIQKMRHSQNPGLKALLNVCGIDPDHLSAYHFGFVLGPCLNATGRMDTAQKAMELLFCRENTEAITIAGELKGLNESRKNLTETGTAQAGKMILEKGMEKDKVLVLFLPEVHESLAGIIAGRIKEQYGRPTFILTRGEEGIKGSGRSIEQYHMYEALCTVEQLLTKFGGHKLAAGFSLEEKNIEAFRRELLEKCTLKDEDFIPSVSIDMELPISYPDVNLVKQMELLEPFGLGNPKPLFVQRDLSFLSGRRMGKEGKYGRFEVRSGDGCRRSLVYFGDMDDFLKDWEERFGEGSGERLLSGKEPHSLHVVYQLSLNEYRGNKEMQLLMKHYR